MQKVKFLDVFEDVTRQATKLQTKDYHAVGKYAIVDQGQDKIAGYTIKTEGIYNKTPIIIFGDHTRIFKYIDFPFFLGADGVKVLSLKRNDFYLKYLYYCLLHENIPNTGYNRHFKWLKDIAFNLIPLTEQKAIAEKLDKVSSLIEKRKQQLSQLDLLVKSQFIEMFGDIVRNERGWRSERMERVAPAEPYRGQISSFGGKYWLLNLDMVEAQTGEIISKVMVDTAGIGNSTTTFGSENVLYSKLRPYLNKVVVPTESGYATSELIPLKPNSEKLNKYYFASALRSDAFVGYIQEQVAGAKMPRVSMGVFRSFLFPCPPIELQERFARFVEQTDKSKFRVKQSLSVLELLKKSLMQKYFG